MGYSLNLDVCCGVFIKNFIVMYLKFDFCVIALLLHCIACDVLLSHSILLNLLTC